MSFTPPPPPPPPPPATVEEKVPPAAWLVPLGAALAVVGAFIPWFRPVVSGTVAGQSHSETVKDAVHSWNDGKIGLLAPIALAVVAFGVVALLTGRQSARFSRGSKGPVVAAARGAMIAGAVSLVAMLIAWAFVPSQYKFTDSGREYSWDDFKKLLVNAGVTNVDLSRGAQAGYWLTVAGAIVVLVGGILMLVTRRKPTEVSGSTFGAAPVGAYPPPVGGQYGPPPANQYGAPQAPQQGWQQPPAAPQAPQQGWQPPAPPQH